MIRTCRRVIPAIPRINTVCCAQIRIHLYRPISTVALNRSLRQFAKYKRMGGSSLWLCPPEGSPLEAALVKLISNTIPTHFGDEKVPSFRPHATITSEVPTGLDPQAVLGSIDIKEPPKVVFSCMKIGETYFTRGTLYLEKNDSLLALATQCREKFAFGGLSKEEAENWAKEKFTPHLSLVYSKLWPVPEVVSKAMEHDVIDASIGISCSSTCCNSNPEATMNGWEGGKLMLVPTDKPISEWAAVAERTL